MIIVSALNLSQVRYLLNFIEKSDLALAQNSILQIMIKKNSRKMPGGENKEVSLGEENVSLCMEHENLTDRS